MEVSNEEGAVYTTFVETYKIISFIMGVGMIYPNPKTEKRKIVCVLLMLISIGPISMMILNDMFNCLAMRDYVNVIRHSTVVGPFLGGFFKILIQFYKRKPAKEIVDEINRDYASYNDMTVTYKKMINASIENNLFYSEKCWAITVVTCVSAFPIMAVLSNLHSTLFAAEPKRYMVHDIILPYAEPEKRFESPIFEIMFAYMLYASVLYIINFIGYDGFFGLCINHACLKMEIYCRSFEDALREDNESCVHLKIVNIIVEQNKLKRFVDLIQDTFNIWLGLILVATMIQIGTCMYLISEGYALDLRYLIFIIGTVVHIYLPCRYAAKLKHMSMETATLIYSGGWERLSSIRIRKMVLFMIARAQIPIEITAFNLMIFDMDLFVTILNSSYSMFTLLRS
uniref:Odorant receptor n=1 Tax=Heliconius melpomene rosina TaxID=171916 RepID=A0A1S5XXM5_HELME|nr:olfactory receptor 14 [Heliconius melpomene rosina]